MCIIYSYVKLLPDFRKPTILTHLVSREIPIECIVAL